MRHILTGVLIHAALEGRLTEVGQAETLLLDFETHLPDMPPGTSDGVVVTGEGCFEVELKTIRDRFTEIERQRLMSEQQQVYSDPPRRSKSDRHRNKRWRWQE